MTKNKYSSLYKYILLLYFIILLPGMGYCQTMKDDIKPNVYTYMGSDNHHDIKDISDNWEFIIPTQNISSSVDLPILASQDIRRISFSKTFRIPDSFRNRQLIIWFPGIKGIADININNIQVLERENLPSAFKIRIPMNLLNISGENNLDIVIRRTETPDDGIPNFVNIFQSPQNLGIMGEIYLEWLPSAYFSDLNYSFKKNKLSFSYQLNIDESFKINNEINPKILCEEEIKDSQGKIIFSRYEYIDLQSMNKVFTRSTYIKDPRYWSPNSTEFYHLRITVKSGSGLIAFLEQKIGLKEILFNDQKMIINNEVISLRGINYRINYPILTKENKADISKDEFYSNLRKDFIDIKNLNFNAVKFPNSPPHPACFFLADSLGLNLFIEIGLWRVPEPYFRDDKFLQISKKVADEIILMRSLHPSFTAMGIGNEIPVHLPSVKKYMLILKGYIEQKLQIPLYLTPLNIELLSQRPLTDFYMLNKYDLSLLKEFSQITKTDIFSEGGPLFFGNVGFSVANTFGYEDNVNPEEIQSARVQEFLELALEHANVGGYFLESYRDWDAASPARLGQKGSSGKYTYPYGLIRNDNVKRDLYYRISQFHNGEYPLPSLNFIPSKKSNFFSISVFIFSIAILFLYRKDYRFRENLKRSMVHPYGFFVDLRDRRIISILNSTIIGLYTNFLVSTLIAAYLYYMRDNLLMEEMLSSVLVPLDLKFIYLELIKSPLYISFFIWLGFYLLQLTIVILLKIINLLAVEKIRFKQYLAACNWAGAPLFLLFPLSMLSYHLMQFELARSLIILILIGFFFWYNFRLGNGLRVLLSMRVYKVFVLLILLYSGAIFTFGAIYESDYRLITYLQLLMDASPLF